MAADRKQPPRRASKGIVWIFLLVSVLSLGAFAAVFLLPAQPQELDSPDPTMTAPVTKQEYLGARQVEVSYSLGSGSAVTSPVAGKLTGFGCSAGSVLTSGAVSISINGVSTVNLATPSPLWRDLRIDDSGEDVSAVQNELARLGYLEVPSGVMDYATLNAVSVLLGAHGIELADEDAMLISQFLWIPYQEAVVSRCVAQMGLFVGADEVLAETIPALRELQVVKMPKGPSGLQRVLQIDGIRVPISEDGMVPEGTDLSGLTRSPTFQQSITAELQSFSAQIELDAPITVAVVPPAAVQTASEGGGCVFSQGKPYAVEIVGSELGQSLVQFKEPNSPSRVDILGGSKKPQCK